MVPSFEAREAHRCLDEKTQESSSCDYMKYIFVEKKLWSAKQMKIRSKSQLSSQQQI